MRRHLRQGPSRKATGVGLTLIELLVAIALLAVVTVLSYRGIDGLTRASERTLAESRRWQDIALFFERFGTDVRQPARRPLRDPNAAEDTASPMSQKHLSPQAQWVMSAAGMVVAANAWPSWWGRPLPVSTGEYAATNFDCPLEFTRKSSTGRGEIRLGYRLRDARLELLIWPVLDRLPDAVARPEIYPLLDGVAALRFRHLDANGAWQDVWPTPGSNDMLPRAVEIDVTFIDGLRLRRVFALPS